MWKLRIAFVVEHRVESLETSHGPFDLWKSPRNVIPIRSGLAGRIKDLPTTRRFGDFLRSRIAVDTSFLTPETDGTAVSSTISFALQHSPVLERKQGNLTSEGRGLLFSFVSRPLHQSSSSDISRQSSSSNSSIIDYYRPSRASSSVVREINSSQNLNF